MRPVETHYLQLLAPWAMYSQKHLYTCPDRPDLICYGPGYNGWGVQTNQKAFAAYAVLASHPKAEELSAALAQEELQRIALGLLRFSLESHQVGSYHCTDGTSWGHTWISALGIERMIHGIEAIEERLTTQDRPYAL